MSKIPVSDIDSISKCNTFASKCTLLCTLWLLIITVTFSIYCFENEIREISTFVSETLRKAVNFSGQVKVNMENGSIQQHFFKSEESVRNPWVRLKVQTAQNSHFHKATKTSTDNLKDPKFNLKLLKENNFEKPLVLVHYRKPKLERVLNAKDSKRRIEKPEEKSQILEDPEFETPIASNTKTEHEQLDFNPGEIRSMALKHLCLDAFAEYGANVGLYWCHGQKGNQFWQLSNNNELKRDGYCADFFGGKGIPLATCHGNYGNQKWIYDPERNTFHHPQSNTCLTLIDTTKVAMEQCTDSYENQQWIWKQAIVSHLEYGEF